MQYKTGIIDSDGKEKKAKTNMPNKFNFTCEVSISEEGIVTKINCLDEMDKLKLHQESDIPNITEAANQFGTQMTRAFRAIEYYHSDLHPYEPGK